MNQTSKWMKLLDGWGIQKEESKKFRCPYCSRKFRSLGGAQGHWASVHEKYGKPKPVYQVKKEVRKDVKEKSSDR